MIGRTVFWLVLPHLQHRIVSVWPAMLFVKYCACQAMLLELLRYVGFAIYRWRLVVRTPCELCLYQVTGMH